MANEPVITVVGNLTGDPAVRYTNSGVPVANFTVASTPRTYNRDTGQWDDGETLFLRCSVWREYAEHVGESLSKGLQVIVQGKLVQRSYTPRDGGEERTTFELQVDEVGPTLRFATAQVQRKPRDGGGQSYQPQSSAPSQSAYQQPADNPWEQSAAVESAPSYSQADAPF